MVAFAGYHMPVQYAHGIIHEHQHTRAAAGLFDVSHMGQVRISGEGAARAMESLAPMDIADLAVGHMRYGAFTDESGGVLDDFMIANTGHHLLVVVNAACKEDDIRRMRGALDGQFAFEELSDRALLALQ